MKKASVQKTKRRPRITKAAARLRAAREIRVRKVRAMLMRRKEIPWRVLFTTLGLGAVLLLVIVAKWSEYDAETAALVPTIVHARPTLLETEIREMVKGYPIEDMAPVIARQDPTVAAFLVSIAKKESNWGKRVPVLDGRDCYNYWGYRGKSEEMGTGGHTCFKNREEAVRRVSKRIGTLVEEQRLDTPSEMIVWKCGHDCSGHSEASVSKWISDVAFYFKKFEKHP